MGSGKYQCRIEGCDSAAEYESHITLWYKGLDGRPIPLNMKATFHVCPSHQIRAAQIINSDKNKEMIAEQLVRQNLGAPDFSSMTIEFKPIVRDRTVIELSSKGLVHTTCGRMVEDASAPGGQRQCVMPAQWQLVLMVRQIGQNNSHRPTPLLMNLHVCNGHRKDITPEHFQDLKTRSMLTGQLAQLGVAMPDFKRLKVDWEPVPDGKPVDPAKFQRSTT